MNVRIVKPFALDKNLGRVYNDEMSRLSEDEWACLMDLDTMFLTSDAGNILHEYARLYPNTGIFTCYTNRITSLSVQQLWSGKVDEERNIERHIEIAEEQKKQLYRVTRLNRVISGFCMMVSKQTWNKHKFPETGKCLQVDNLYSRKIMQAGLPVHRANGLYIFHLYRMKNGVLNKKHLL